MRMVKHAEVLMKHITIWSLAVVAAVLFCQPATAGGKILSAPVTKIIKKGLKSPATSQFTNVPGYTDFDAFNAINDPLFRTGSKALLKKAIKEKPSVPAGHTLKNRFRDAPNSKVVPTIKRPRGKEPLRADPVKMKKTL